MVEHPIVIVRCDRLPKIKDAGYSSRHPVTFRLHVRQAADSRLRLFDPGTQDAHMAARLLPIAARLQGGILRQLVLAAANA